MFDVPYKKEKYSCAASCKSLKNKSQDHKYYAVLNVYKSITAHFQNHVMRRALHTTDHVTFIGLQFYAKSIIFREYNVFDLPFQPR